MVKLKSPVFFFRMCVNTSILQWKVLHHAKVNAVNGILIKAYECMLNDLGIPRRDYVTIRKRMLCEGFAFASITLPKLGKALELGISTGRFVCPSDFAVLGDSHLPKFLHSLFRQLFDADGEMLLGNENGYMAVRSIRQICYYAYKADLPRDPVKDQAVVDSFVATETELAEWKCPQDAIIQLASTALGEVFKGCTLDSLSPKHGPGVTSNTRLTDKYEHRLTPGLPVYSAFGKEFFFNPSDAMDRLHRFPVYQSSDYFRMNHTAKVILVPKDSRGPRLISCEPCENQYIQQGILKIMVNRLQSHPLTGGHVNFTDQTINQDMAVKASSTLEWSTLDLKDASDRVSLDLVKKVFVHTPLINGILACRTHQTELPSGERLLLSKHAPMGSALCFPVMAATIWSLLFAGFIGIGLTPVSAAQSIFVYGDDIIVPTDLADYAIRILERYALRVNRNKSFIGSRFAESCGMDCFDGHDVTPVRLRRIWEFDQWTTRVNSTTTTSGVKNALSSTTAPSKGNGRRSKDNTNSRKKVQITKDLIPHLPVYYTKHANELPSGQLSEYWYGLAESLLGSLPIGTKKVPYLCRLTNATTWKHDLAIWRDLQNGARSRFKAIVVVPEQDSEKHTTFWGHLSRVWRMYGIPGNETPSYGIYDLPKRWYLSRRTIRSNHLFKWDTSVDVSIPDWLSRFG